MSTTTEHYELNIAEGTDLVNPLIDTFPNFTKIDEAMWNNKLGGVILATHLLSGSVHAITLEPQDATMFRFVATANYTVGQTFTVNGQQVTGLTTNGTTLSNNAFVTNQNVLCCLVGTNLTFYVNNNIDEAEDSKKLGGQLPEYYATSAQAQSAISTAQAAQTIAQGAQSTANEALSAADGTIPALLWTNPNPGATFSKQDVSIPNLSNYNSVMVLFLIAAIDQRVYSQIMVTRDFPKGTAIFSSAASIDRRDFSVNFDANTITFENATTVNQSYRIPIYVYGLKW